MPPLIDQHITDVATARWGAVRNPRLAEIVRALIGHLHDFARDVQLTEQEWATAMDWLTRAGQISDDKRSELILASDVLGLSMLVVEMNYALHPGATSAAVFGPFHIEGSPELEFGADMAYGVPGEPLYIVGTVRDLDGRAIGGATLDVWQADADGMYEAQLDTAEARLRGKYTSRPDGTYCVRTVAPRGYSIPMDGPVGELISRTGISHFRPAHVHFRISAPGYEPLTTHLFQKNAAYLESDVVFGTKADLVVEFQRRPPGSTPDGRTSDVPWLLATYVFVLQPLP